MARPFEINDEIDSKSLDQVVQFECDINNDGTAGADIVCILEDGSSIKFQDLTEEDQKKIHELCAEKLENDIAEYGKPVSEYDPRIDLD